ncbi:MAG: restriction endonuclease subunit S [Candidatus Humimicrobiaceae bacterium]
MGRAMKDSGVEWIGEIPTDWKVVKLKYLGDLDANGVDKKIQDGEKLFKSVHYMNVYNNSLSEIKNSEDYLIISANDIKANSCNLLKGDVLFTNSSETPDDMGHSTVVIESLTNTLFGYHLMRFRPKVKIHLQFEKYLFGSYYMRKWFEYRSIGMTRYGVSYSDFANVLIILPPLSNQQAIADYLDTKCSIIDSTIEKQKLVIEKFKSYKQSLITEAVTKGLDPTVKMKPSGVEWIGDIPEGWGTIKNKYCSYIKGRIGWQGLKTDEFIEEGPYLVTGTDFDKSFVNWESCVHITIERYNEATPIQLRENDLLITKDGSIGKLAIVKSKPKFASLNSGIFVVRPLNNIYLTKYLYFVLLSKIFNDFFAVNRGGTTIVHLYQETFMNFAFPLPPLSEQQSIADYLDSKCAGINNVIIEKQKLIEKLIDYKKSLIYECVTGKKEIA